MKMLHFCHLSWSGSSEEEVLFNLLTRPEGFFPGGATRGFFQILSREWPKVVKFVFSHSKLRKQPFLLKISKYRGGQGPLCPLFWCPCSQAWPSSLINFRKLNRAATKTWHCRFYGWTHGESAGGVTFNCRTSQSWAPWSWSWISV